MNLLVVESHDGKEIGLIQHNRDLDQFHMGKHPDFMRRSASADMALDVLVRLADTVLQRYGEGRLQPNYEAVRKHLRIALKHLVVAHASLAEETQL